VIRASATFKGASLSSRLHMCTAWMLHYVAALSQSWSTCMFKEYALKVVSLGAGVCGAAALMDLRNQLTNGPLPSMDTWAAMQSPPCSPWDAVCQPCTNPSLCGQPFPQGAGLPPRWYCSMHGVSCDADGNRRVTAVSLRNVGAQFIRLPASLGQLTSLQTLGEWCHCAACDDCLMICQWCFEASTLLTCPLYCMGYDRRTVPVCDDTLRSAH
jgi:hypothetical protein